MKTASRLFTILTVMSLMLFFGAGVMAAEKYPVPQTVKDWVSEGKFIKFEGLDIFVHSSGRSPVDGHGVLVVHGWPGSSWDWANVVPPVAKKTKIVVPDMIGFGQSDKPLKGTYKENFSLMRQADLYEAVAKAEGLKEVVLVAHDMGQTVGLELMTRHDEGKLSFKIRHAILLDGSSLVDMVELVPLQKELLEQPDKALTKHLDFKEYAEGARSSYGKGNATDEILTAQAAQTFAKDGDLIIGNTLKYLLERKEFYDRWIGTFAHFRTAPTSIYWGVQDPVAVIAMAERIKTWNPTIDLYKIEESGHWPSIEVPDIISDAILARIPLYR